MEVATSTGVQKSWKDEGSQEKVTWCLTPPPVSLKATYKPKGHNTYEPNGKHLEL